MDLGNLVAAFLFGGAMIVALIGVAMLFVIVFETSYFGSYNIEKQETLCEKNGMLYEKGKCYNILNDKIIGTKPMACFFEAGFFFKTKIRQCYFKEGLDG